MKKVSTIRLFIILVVLLLIYGLSEYLSNTGRSKSLRNVLVTIDPEAVTQIVISSEGKTTTISKKELEWYVSNGDYEFKADADKVSNAVSTLQTIIPSRIATRNPEKWKEFQVDSSGVRVSVMEGNEKSLDIILGRFGMQGQQFHTYVRLYDENDVYVANNFMSFSLPGNSNGYRNGKVVSIAADSIKSINFQYNDSSFMLIQSLNGGWLADQESVDSVKVSSYFNTLKNKISSSFYEGDPGTTINQDIGLEVLLISNRKITISAQVSGDGLLIQSSTNKDALFTDPSLFDQLFISKSSLLSDQN